MHDHCILSVVYGNTIEEIGENTLEVIDPNIEPNNVPAKIVEILKKKTTNLSAPIQVIPVKYNSSMDTSVVVYIKFGNSCENKIAAISLYTYHIFTIRESPIVPYTKTCTKEEFALLIYDIMMAVYHEFPPITVKAKEEEQHSCTCHSCNNHDIKIPDQEALKSMAEFMLKEKPEIKPDCTLIDTDTIKAIKEEVSACETYIRKLDPKYRNPILYLASDIQCLLNKGRNGSLVREDDKLENDLCLIFILSLDIHKKLKDIMNIEEEDCRNLGLELITDQFKTWHKLLVVYTQDLSVE